MKSEYDGLKAQSTNAETFRNQLIKERELHQKTKEDSDKVINELKERIEILEAPPKRKKTVKNTPVVETVIKEQPIVDDTVKDGGSF